MKHSLKIVPAIAIVAASLVLNSSKLYSQESKDSIIARYNMFSESSSPEKLFIHTDKELYIAGEYIWFKGYLRNSSDLSRLPESNFIYAELYQDTIISRVKIKRTEDGFAGNLPLSHKLSSGNYILRGYTSWMMNSRPEYMFHKHITVINPADKTEKRVNRDSDTLTSVDFYPESGVYLKERFGVIAFKATGSSGSGYNLDGELFNLNDSLITTFKTEYNGMGVIMFYPVSGEKYYVKVPDGKGGYAKFDVPDPVNTGAMLNVRRRDGKYYLNATLSRDISESGAKIFIHDGSEIFFAEEIRGEQKLLVIGEDKFSKGINHILITDNNANILSERLIFIYEEGDSKISLFADKDDEARSIREKATLIFKLTDSSGKPLKGEFSLSVTDHFLAPADSLNDNIKSYMLLSSELKGSIENPAYYFTPQSQERDRAMELLMMVQGWRYYDLPVILSGREREIIKTPVPGSLFQTRRVEQPQKRWFDKEYIQQISGRATSTFRNTKRAILSVLAPEINLAVSENLTSNGRFTITDIDFPDSTNFIVSCTGKEGQKGYYVELEEQKLPAPYSKQFINKGMLPADKTIMMAYSQLFYESGGMAPVNLNAAVVSSSPQVRPKYNPSPFNQYFDRKQLRERSDLDLYTGMSLLDYVVGNFPGLMYGPQGEDGLRSVVSTRSFNITGEKGSPVVYINRAQVQSTGDLDMYTVDDIENVAFLKGSDGFMFRTLSGVILVTLRKAALSTNTNWYYNTKLLNPLGWQKPAKFYSPDYSQERDNSAVVFDSRTVLYWNPKITTDENGVAEVSFYTSDRKTRLNIDLQGVTQNGEFVSYRRY
ncbi:MAG: hypothetical protein AB9922_04440 [Bacteroidales bacterium]